MKPFLDEQGLVISIEALSAGGKAYPWREMGRREVRSASRVK